MLSIRLSRKGRTHAPTYRVVVMPKHQDPYGKTTEVVGHYDPRAKEITLKTDRIKHWLSKGAQPTDTVWNLLVDQKIVEGKKRGVTHITKKRTAKLEEKAAEAKAKEEEAKAKAEEEKKAAEEAKAAEAEAAKAEAEAPSEEAPAEEAKEEAPAEEEKKEETPAEEAATEAEEKAEEKTEE